MRNLLSGGYFSQSTVNRLPSCHLLCPGA